MVLKYCLLHTPERGPGLRRKLRAKLTAILPRYKAHNPPHSPRNNPGVADGIAAVRYVRRQAGELRVNPNHIGMLGFSAEGVVTQRTIIYGGPNSRLGYTGLNYGAFKVTHVGVRTCRRCSSRLRVMIRPAPSKACTISITLSSFTCSLSAGTVFARESKDSLAISGFGNLLDR